MHSRAEWLQKRRQLAWERGRLLRDDLLTQFATTYGCSTTPPPAKIGDEIITDILGAELRFDPLPTNVFAQTEWVRGRPRVTINSRTADIRGVRDADGVQNVGKWHEVIHITDDLDALRAGVSAAALPGFEVSPRIVCYRSEGAKGSPEAAAREFWAEEAGRAAAVSFEALARTGAFRELCKAASTGSGPITGGFPLLYGAAEEIGVNTTALVKQLTLEGWIVVTKESGRNVVYVQPRLNELAGMG
jgi:hypothetical protein